MDMLYNYSAVMAPEATKQLEDPKAFLRSLTIDFITFYDTESSYFYGKVGASLALISR